MLFIRKLLFLGFTVVYITLCPLLILYALGYIYSPVAGKLIQTGVLHIASIPQGADVYLEESHYTHRTPATISDLLPGEYKITLNKKGYKPWTQEIAIEAGKAVAFKDVILVPYSWPTKVLTSSGYQNLFDVGKKRLFLAAAGPSLGDFFIYNTGDGSRPLLSPASAFSSLSVTDVYPITNNSALIIYAGPFWDRKRLYLNLQENEPNAVDITKLLSGEPSFALWQGKREDLFYPQKKCINRVAVETRETFPCWLDGVKGFGILNEWVYVIDQNDILTRRPFDAVKEEILSGDTFAVKRLFRSSEFYKIDAQNEEIIFFLGDKGDLIVNLPPYYVAAEGVLGYKFAGNLNMLLYWTKKSIGIVDFSAGKKNEFFAEGYSIRPVYETGRDIKQAFWLGDDSHILCNDAGSVYLIEIPSQGPAHAESIVKIKDHTKIFFDSDEKALFFLDENSGVLKRIEIISKEPLTIIPLPKRD